MGNPFSMASMESLSPSAAAEAARLRHGARRRALLLALAASPFASPVARPVAGPVVANLKVAIINIAPFGMQDDSGSPSGLFVDILGKLSERSGMQFDHFVTPFPRAMALMASGEADLIFALDNPQLLQSSRHVALVAHEEVVLIARAGMPLRGLDDLYGKQIGYIRGANYDDAIMANLHIAKHETNNAQQTVEMLLRGRFDAALGTRLALLYALRAAGVGRDKLGAPLVLKQMGVWLSYSKQRYRAERAQRLANAVDALRAEGVFSALRQQYVATEAP